jgi:flagellar basal body rod protein FlgB
MKKMFFILFLLSRLVMAQDKIDGFLYDDTLLRLEGEIKKSIRKQAIYAHNIANAKVDGYRPIRFEDELNELKSRPGWSIESDKVVMEEEMAKMTKNRIRHQTFLRLYNLKLEVLRKVATQGKG